MAAETRFELVYWPLPFRGCFVSYLFAWCDVPLKVVDDYEVIEALIERDPGEQPIPFVGPPLLRDRQTGQSLSQMPAIALYAAGELDLLPADPADLPLSMKVLMDCNDVLMEICRYNGSMMWEREEWIRFRGVRLPRWLRVFEESMVRGHIGRERVTFADIGVYALFGNLLRCLPELEPDVHAQAPGIHALCERIGSRETLAAFVATEEQRYGKLYCGGQIEASIRRMLEMDAR